MTDSDLAITPQTQPTSRSIRSAHFNPAHSALLTDQYELVMAHGYFELGLAETESVFYLGYRAEPFGGNYTVFCGLNDIIDYCQNFHFSDSDLDYLATLARMDEFPQFSDEFIEYCRNLKFSCSINAAPEGTVMFAREPLLRVQGPLLQCQLLETALINLTNYATLTATKASRIREAAGYDTLVEFGLRRAHGPNGGLIGSRAAFLGGCDSTSNVLCGKIYDIPINGTQAHSWIMAFPDELTAFREFAKIQQDNTTLLVDTYDTHVGVKNALIVGNELRNEGFDLFAIRLDSGDLVKLSKDARQMLDEAGFTNTKIMASGDLDEYSIKRLKDHGAKIDAWGVGTKLSTCYDQPSLNMIYKLCAIRPMIESKNNWDYKLKISDQPQKTTTAGIPQIRRYFDGDHVNKDVLFDVEMGIESGYPKGCDSFEDILVEIFDRGQLVYDPPRLIESQQRAREQVTKLMKSNLPIPLEMEPQMYELQSKLLSLDN